MSKDRRQIFRSTELIRKAQWYISTEGGQQITEYLNTPRFTTKESSASYRVTTFWTEQGLLEDNRPEGTGWRKYSLLEMVWLDILIQLRAFGVSIEQLRSVKGYLDIAYFWVARLADRPPHVMVENGVTHTKYEIEDVVEKSSHLEFYTFLTILERVPVFLVVFNDGQAELLTYEEYHNTLRLHRPTHHVTISLNHIVQRFFPDTDLTPVYERTLVVNDDEFEALFMLRTGNYDSLTLHRKGGKIERIEVQETVEGTSIVDILKDSDYQDIEIKKRDGKVVSVKRKTLKKL